MTSLASAIVGSADPLSPESVHVPLLAPRVASVEALPNFASSPASAGRSEKRGYGELPIVDHDWWNQFVCHDISQSDRGP